MRQNTHSNTGSKARPYRLNSDMGQAPLHRRLYLINRSGGRCLGVLNESNRGDFVKWAPYPRDNRPRLVQPSRCDSSPVAASDEYELTEGFSNAPWGSTCFALNEGGVLILANLSRKDYEAGLYLKWCELPVEGSIQIDQAVEQDRFVPGESDGYIQAASMAPEDNPTPVYSVSGLEDRLNPSLDDSPKGQSDQTVDVEESHPALLSSGLPFAAKGSHSLPSLQNKEQWDRYIEQIEQELEKPSFDLEQLNQKLSRLAKVLIDIDRSAAKVRSQAPVKKAMVSAARYLKLNLPFRSIALGLGALCAYAGYVGSELGLALGALGLSAWLVEFPLETLSLSKPVHIARRAVLKTIDPSVRGLFDPGYGHHEFEEVKSLIDEICGMGVRAAQVLRFARFCDDVQTNQSLRERCSSLESSWALTAERSSELAIYLIASVSWGVATPRREVRPDLPFAFSQWLFSQVQQLEKTSSPCIVAFSSLPFILSASIEGTVANRLDELVNR